MTRQIEGENLNVKAKRIGQRRPTGLRWVRSYRAHSLKPEMAAELSRSVSWTQPRCILFQVKSCLVRTAVHNEDDYRSGFKGHIPADCPGLQLVTAFGHTDCFLTAYGHLQRPVLDKPLEIIDALFLIRKTDE